MAIDYERDFEEALNSPPSADSDQIFLSEPLTTKQRKALSDFEFAYVYYNSKGEKIRKYPVHDKSHAINAMARLNAQYNKGNIKPATYKKIRARILKAYKKFGINSKATSAIKQSRKSELPMAAEPGCGFSGNCMESKMAMTKAQKRQNALKNLRKAWKARGLKPAFESAAEPKPRKSSKSKSSGKKLTKTQRAAISRRNLAKARKARSRKASPAYVYEPAPRKAKKAKTKAGTGASRSRTLTAAQARREEEKIMRQRAAKAAASKKASVAKKRAATRAKGKTSNRGKWPREVPIGRYKGMKEGNVIEIKRVYTKKNPDWSNGGVIAAGAGGLLLGVVGSDLADRFVATMAPQGAAKALTGTAAIAAIRTKANAWRLGTSALGTAVGIGGAYMASRYDNDYLAVGFGGFGLAFGVKFLTQLIVDVVMPVVFKVDTSTEDSISNRLYPDKQDYAGLSASNGDDTGVTGVGRPKLFSLPKTRSIGPIATNGVGTAGCGGTGPAHSFLASVARRHMAGVSGTCGNSGGCSGSSCVEGACNDPTVPGYAMSENGNTKTPSTPGQSSKVPGYRDQSSNVSTTIPDIPSNDYNGVVAQPQGQSDTYKTPKYNISPLQMYKVKMQTPSNRFVAGVGTAGVYGHLFKKAV